MEKRLAEVDGLLLNSIVYSSIINIGDTAVVTPISRALALQKASAIFHSKNDLQFEDYSIFNREANWIETPHHARLKNCHRMKTIHVKQVSITAASMSSIVQVGSIGKINAESRVKHIRKLPGNM